MGVLLHVRPINKEVKQHYREGAQEVQRLLCGDLSLAVLGTEAGDQIDVMTESCKELTAHQLCQLSFEDCVCAWGWSLLPQKD